jgi:hypothetical protein
MVSKVKPTSARRKTVIGKLLLALGTVFLCLLLAEMALRVFDYGYANSPTVAHARLHHVHPGDFSFRAYTPKGDYSGHIVRFDQYGFRVPGPEKTTASANESRPISARVVFIGDSFVEAKQVTYEDSFVGILESEKPCIKAFNLGVSSYSPILSHLQLKEYEDYLSPNIVVHVLFANDVGNDKRYGELALTDETGKILAVPGKKSPIFVLLRKSYLARLVRRAQLILEYHLSKKGSGLVRGQGSLLYQTRISAATKQALLDIQKWAQSRQAKYAIACVPRKSKYNEGNDRINEFCDDATTIAQQSGIDFVDLDEFFRNNAKEKPYFDRDSHWNEYGHRLVASAMNNYLEAMGIDCARETATN